MVKHLNVTEICTILRSGGGMTVNALQFNPTELSTMARSLEGSAILYVVNAQAFNATQLSTIARSAHTPAHVSFSGSAD